MGVPLVKGGQNLPPIVGIGLTGLPNIGGPPGPPVPAPLQKIVIGISRGIAKV